MVDPLLLVQELSAFQIRISKYQYRRIYGQQTLCAFSYTFSFTIISTGVIKILLMDYVRFSLMGPGTGG